MVVVGVLLACSLVTVAAVVVMCELQARMAQSSSSIIVLPATERARFDAIVAPLLADPDFGRVDS